MAYFYGDMSSLTFISEIYSYNADSIGSSFGTIGNDYSGIYYGTFNYTPNSPMNKDTFMGGVVHEYRELDHYDGTVTLDNEISSFSLDFSEFQNANFDKDILLPKIFSGDDVLRGYGINGYGGNDTIYGSGNGGEGNDVLYGGTGADVMIGSTGNDTFYVNDRMDRIVEKANEGYDKASSSVTFSLKGADVETLALTGSDAIGAVGNELNNKLVGNDAGNKMQGLEGNDALYGGLGRDALYGGSGNDSFIFDTAPGTNNLDAIYDFANVSGDNDTIRLDDIVFTALSGTGRIDKTAFAQIDSSSAVVSSDAHILYDQASGALFYDADGGTASGRVQIALLANHVTLTFKDFLVI